MAMTLEQEREAFEKWARCSPYPLGLSRCLDAYSDSFTSMAWYAWQARAHLTQPAQAVDVGAIQEVAHGLSVIAESADTGMKFVCQSAANKLTRALAGEQAGWRVPDGWRLVPTEASPEMLDAAIDAFGGFNGEDEVDAVWAAMLAASPEREEGE